MMTVRVQPSAFLGAGGFSRNIFSIGQSTTDPVILAKVDLAEAYGNAVQAVSKVANVTPEFISASAETAKMTFLKFLENRAFLGYVMKLLVLSAVVVKEKIPALGLTPQQLANILVGGEAAVKEILPEADIKTQLKAYQDEIVSKAPANLQAAVRKLIEGSGITPENLAPNVPEGAVKEEVGPQAAPGLTGLEKAALIGVPLVVLAAVGFALKS